MSVSQPWACLIICKIIGTLLNLCFMVIFCIAYCSQAVCAEGIAINKAPQEFWAKLETGESLDLIVVFDNSAIQAQAAQLNKERGLLFDDNETIRFKADSYTSIKADVISALPSEKVEILKNYDVLPLMFLRIRSAEALKTLLAHPSVLRVQEDRKEDLMRQESKP